MPSINRPEIPPVLRINSDGTLIVTQAEPEVPYDEDDANMPITGTETSDGDKQKFIKLTQRMWERLNSDYDSDDLRRELNMEQRDIDRAWEYFRRIVQQELF